MRYSDKVRAERLRQGILTPREKAVADTHKAASLARKAKKEHEAKKHAAKGPKLPLEQRND